MKGRIWVSALLILAVAVAGIGKNIRPVSAAPAFRIVAYSGIYSSAINVGQVTSQIWEVVTPASPWDMTLVPLEGDLGDISAMVSKSHAAGRPIEVTVYAPWDNPDYNVVFTNSWLRAELFRNIVAFIDRYGFDGVNFDWECDNWGIAPTDITQFYRELYAILNPRGKTISATENAGGVIMTTEAAAYLDYIGIMVYDVAPSVTWFGTFDDVVSEMNLWANAGFPKKKLLAGINFGVRTTYAEGWFPYRMIVDTYNPSPGLNQVAGYAYNGISLVEQKAKWVRDNGFGGVFTYGTELDKFNDSRSLLQHIYTVLSQPATSPAPTAPSPTPAPVAPSPTPTPPAPATPPSYSGVTHQLTVSVQGQGTTSYAPGVHNIPERQTITVTATPAAGWKFRTWSWPGNAADYAGWSNNPTSWIMTGDVNLIAVFDAVAPATPAAPAAPAAPAPTPPAYSGVTHQLNVTVQGQGTTSYPAGVHSIPDRQVVTVTATPASGWKFRSWSWPGNSADYAGWPNNPTSWTMTGDVNLVAVFDAVAPAAPAAPTPTPQPAAPAYSGVTHQLNVTVQGQGTTSYSAGVHSIPDRQTVTMTATPASGWKFRTWSWPGNSASYAGWPNNPTSWTMTGDVNIVAIFDALSPATPTTPSAPAPQPATPAYSGVTHDLNVIVQGKGSTSYPAGKTSIPDGQTVTITAIPAPGWRFRSWSWPGNSPDYAGWTDQPVSWTMNRDVNLVVIFDPA